MKRSILLCALMFIAAQGYAQNTLKVEVNPEADLAGKGIILIRLLPENNYATGEVIVRGEIKEDGSFVFPDSVFTGKDEIYKVQIQESSSGKKGLDTAINNFKTFILSNTDIVRFNLGNSVLSNYNNTNKADKEWQKLKKYEDQISSEEKLDPENYLRETRNYTKDSLEILLVKLLSIKTLDEKQLLEKDIKENADFYLDLLEKLQESDLDSATYAYLENKIRATHQEIINRKYKISLALNFFGFSGIVGLLFVVFSMHKKSGSVPAVELSRQEEKIKDLILEGKTNKEIAGELFISISTVKTHTSNIYSKLSISNRKDLVLQYQNHTGTST